MVTFSEISPSEFPSLYHGGMSIKEIATSVDRSYTYVRNNLVALQTRLRTKGEGTREYLRNHPEWSRQFVKYSVREGNENRVEKTLLMTMIITEGYADRRSVGFTNTQPMLREQFKKLIEEVYGPIHLGTNNITTRLSSVDIAGDVARSMNEKTFSEPMLTRITASAELTRRVLRIVADTEGSMIISIKKATRNYTVECRVVLASKNRRFSEQLASILSNIGIESHVGSTGVQISAKAQIIRFIKSVGFSPGVTVVRKKAGLSTWYGKEKAKLSKLCLEVYRRQGIARAAGRRGCFEECETRLETLSKLNSWYDAPSEVTV